MSACCELPWSGVTSSSVSSVAADAFVEADFTVLRVTVARAITGYVARFDGLGDCDRGHDCGAFHAKFEKFKPGGCVRLAMPGRHSAGIRLDRLLLESKIFLGQDSSLAMSKLD